MAQLTIPHKNNSLPSGDPDRMITAGNINDIIDTINENDVVSDLASLTATVGGLSTTVSGKQATLVSGTNIKTINSGSILGSGDIALPTNGALDLKLTITKLKVAIPTGTVNGSNTAFTLPADSLLLLFADGMVMIPGSDFTRTGTSITMGVAPSTAIYSLYIEP